MTTYVAWGSCVRSLAHAGEIWLMSEKHDQTDEWNYTARKKGKCIDQRNIGFGTSQLGD